MSSDSGTRIGVVPLQTAGFRTLDCLAFRAKQGSAGRGMDICAEVKARAVAWLPVEMVDRPANSAVIGFDLLLARVVVSRYRTSGWRSAGRFDEW